MALLTAPAERAGDPELAPAVAADIDKFEHVLAEYLAGRVDEDAFRVFRLNNGVYGQRQGGHNQMVRIKFPGGAVTPAQLDVLADVADAFSRGWGHLTTRQNVQFHFVQLERVPALLRQLAAVGLTTREACGDTVRNVMACHLAGACPAEVLDVGPWAEATFRHFLHHPYAQRLPRKFKINFSGCARDCGQAMFNDVGVVAVHREGSDGRAEPGFRVFLGGGLGANPHPAQALEPFTARDDLLVTIEAVLRTFDHDGERHRRSAPADPAGAHPAAGVVELARRRPRTGRCSRRRTGRRRSGRCAGRHPGPAGLADGPVGVRAVAGGQRGGGCGLRRRLGRRPRTPRRPHRRPVPGPRLDDP
ncbi:MAG: nitrite/sulfite reductase [Actinomycetota bacterium]|nr:nitrite/sulfite reductase [Actinomycetota bacterium]